ncbi:hypothetical protein SGPA1_60172 [Streptomyces misionensis JCM 4497]
MPLRHYFFRVRSPGRARQFRLPCSFGITHWYLQSVHILSSAQASRRTNGGAFYPLSVGPPHIPRGRGTHRRQQGHRGRHRGGRPRRAGGRGDPGAPGACGGRGHRQHEEDRRSGAGRRQGVSRPAAAHTRRIRRGRLLPAPAAARGRLESACRAFGVLPDRSRVLGGHRLYRHVARRTKQCPGRRGGPGSHTGRRRTRKRPHDRLAHRDEDRISHGRCRRHVHRGPRPAGCLLCGAGLCRRRAEGPGGLRSRRRSDRHVHACGRRHLHQGRRRRRRPGRQGRAGHSGGRPAQCRDHRRQRGRQRRRLRRHGGRPVRVLRRHPGGRTDPRQGRVRRLRARLPAAGARHRGDHRDDRHLRGRPAPRRPQRHVRDQPRLLHLRGDLPRAGRRRGLRLPAVDVLRPQRCHGRGDQGQGRRPADPRPGRGGHRHPARRRHPAADRLLHRDHPAPGPRHRQDVPDRSRHRRAVRHLGRPGVRRLHRAAHRARRVRRVPARRHLDHARAVRGGAGRHRPAHHGRRDRGHGHLRAGLRQRAGHRRDVRRRRGRGRAGAHQPGRGRQHHQGHHQGHRHRHRRARRVGAVRVVPRRDHHQCAGRRGQAHRAGRAAEPVPGHLAAQQPGRSDRGRRGRLPLLRPGHQRRVAFGGFRRVRGAAAVPREARDHGLHGEARVRQGRRHLHQGRPAGAGHARPARGDGADLRRVHARRRLARLLPGRRDRRGHADGGVPRQLRRRLGQRQEAGGGRPPRRQGQRGPRGHGDRRHGRRPLQGHRGPGHQPAAEGHEPGLAAHRARGDQVLLRQRQEPRRADRDRDPRAAGDHRVRVRLQAARHRRRRRRERRAGRQLGGRGGGFVGFRAKPR